MGRIIAVVLFLGLGTFAVTQSLMGPSSAPEVSQAGDLELAETKLQVDPAAVANQTPKIEFGQSSNPKPETSGFKSSFSSAPTVPTKSTAFKATPFSPRTNPETAKSSSSAGGFKVTTPTRNPAAVARNPLPKFDPGGFSPAKSNPIGNPARLPKTGLPQFADNAAKDVAQKVNEAAGNAVQKSNELINQTKSGLSNSFNSLGSRLQGNPATSPPSGNPFATQAPKPAPTTPAPAQRNLAQLPTRLPPRQSPTTPPTDSGFNAAKSLPPITSNNLRGSQGGPARNSFGSDLTRSNNSGGFQASTPSNTSSRTNPPRTPVALNPRQMPERRTTPPASPAPTQRRGVPAVQASASRTLPPVTSGVLTLPTPGESTLEGSRTPSITVQRVAPREIQLNTPADFEIIVKNTGRIEANDVRIYDQIPTGTQLIEATPQPTVNDGRSLQWQIGKLAPGQERRILLQLKPTQPGEIGSVAHVTFATRASVRTLVTKPELVITHSAPAKSLIGDEVLLDIVVTNKGNGPATDVVVQEEIPGQLEYPDGFRRIEYPVGTLVPGQSRKLQLNLRAADVGRLKNIVHATAAGNLRARHAVDMEIVAPKLVANSTGPRRRYLRRQATHEFNVQNNGTAAATNVEMMAKMPPGLKFVSANNQGQYDPATHAVYWSLTRLESSTPVAVSLTSVPVDTGNQNIEFTAVADLKQKVATSAGLVVEHLVDVFFEIDDLIDHIEVGSDTKYQLRIVNQGTKTATNVRIGVDFASGVRPTNIEGSLEGQVQGQRVQFAPITSMNPGDEITVAINATGSAPGEHKVVARMSTDGREINIAKEETTQVYSDR